MWCLLVALAQGGDVSLAKTAVPVVLEDVHVLTERGTLTGPHNVHLANGIISKIENLGPSVGVRRTLMAGLIDAHVHVVGAPAVPGPVPLPQPRRNLEIMLAHGVTSMFDAASGRHCEAGMMRRLEKGRWIGPDLYTSAGAFTGVKGHPYSSLTRIYPSPIVKAAIRASLWEIGAKKDVDRALKRQPVCGALKIMIDEIPDGSPNIPTDALHYLVDAAHARGDKVVAHVGHPDDVDTALDAGVDVLVHTPYKAPLRDDQIERLVAQDVPVMTTLTVWEGLGRVHTHGHGLSEADQSWLTHKQQERFDGASSGSPIPGVMGEWIDDEIVATQGIAADNVRRLYEGGVTLLIGADGPGVGTVPGANLHRELTLVEAAGVPRQAVLSAVTWNNARFLDADGEFGAVRQGWRADVLLVSGDPTASGPLVIEAIWKDGRPVDQSQ
jgi:imidazolonepropionase-like amidohydrolase